jgi:hypothetical protein
MPSPGASVWTWPRAGRVAAASGEGVVKPCLLGVGARLLRGIRPDRQCNGPCAVPGGRDEPQGRRHDVDAPVGLFGVVDRDKQPVGGRGAGQAGGEQLQAVKFLALCGGALLELLAVRVGLLLEALDASARGGAGSCRRGQPRDEDCEARDRRARQDDVLLDRRTDDGSNACCYGSGRCGQPKRWATGSACS